MAMTRAQVVTSTRLAGCVRRYHCWPMLDPGTVASHSWQVARLWLEIFGPDHLDPAYRAPVLEYIVHHDTSEIATGDPPFPLKANDPSLRVMYSDMEAEALDNMGVSLPAVSQRQRTQIKICDLLDMWEHGQQELMMGNRYAQPIIDDTREAALVLAASLDITDSITSWIKAHF